MKNSKKILTGLLVFCMILVSGGVLYASIYASSTPVAQPTAATIVFDAPSGIRFNNSSTEPKLEIFTAAGISWIDTDVWVNEAGDLLLDVDGKPIQLEAGKEPKDFPGLYPLFTDAMQATGKATYKVMNDIEFSKSGTFYSDFGSSTVAGTLPTLEKEGVFDGGGHTLKNFPIRKHKNTTPEGLVYDYRLLDTYYCYSTLFYMNIGIIKDLKLSISDITLSQITFANSSIVGIVVALNSEALFNYDTLLSTKNGGRVLGVDVIARLAIKTTTSSSIIVGGITGYSVTGSVESSSFSGFINGDMVGGIVGLCSAQVVNSFTHVGSLITGKVGGGIVGYAFNVALDVQEYDGDMGWRYGSFGSGYSVIGCINNAEVSGDTVGGAFGLSDVDDISATVSEPCSVKDFINLGAVRGVKAGGLVGVSKSQSKYFRAIGIYNYGNVLGEFVGGIVGEVNSITARGSSDLYGVYLELKDIYNFGKVIARTVGGYCGGVIGFMSTSTSLESDFFNNIVNYGDVQGGVCGVIIGVSNEYLPSISYLNMGFVGNDFGSSAMMYNWLSDE